MRFLKFWTSVKINILGGTNIEFEGINILLTVSAPIALLHTFTYGYKLYNYV